jgi:hypothetical protein
MQKWIAYMADPAHLSAICTLISTIVAAVALWKGFREYQKQGSQKRTDLFLEMRRRYHEFDDICANLESKFDPGSNEYIRKLSFARKRAFIGFYEELALMTQSGLINWQVAHYMFGYYAIKCFDSEIFWDREQNGLNSGDHYWRLFGAFVKRAKIEEKWFKEHRFRYTIYRL